MQKTCKTENCNRKFERTSLCELCPPCANAFKVGQVQSTRRMENSSRQTQARSSSYDNNRELTMSPPNTQQQPPPPASDLASAQPIPGIDVNRLQETFNSLGAGSSAGPNPNPAMKDMFAMLMFLCSKSGESEQMKQQLSTNNHRLDRIEAKLGGPDDIAVPLSLVIHGLPLPAPGTDEIELVKALFKEIFREVAPPPGINIDSDIRIVVRKGASDQNPGSVMVEMSSDEARAIIMKNKFRLENHHNPGLRRVYIKNMKERHELKTDIALGEMLKMMPGGENFYIANNGHIREKNNHQRRNQHNLNANLQPIQRPPIRPHSRFQANQPPFNPPNPNFQPNQVLHTTSTDTFQHRQGGLAPATTADSNLIQFNSPFNQVQPPNFSSGSQNVFPTPSMTNTFPTWSFPPPPLPTISMPLGPPAVPTGFVFTGAGQPSSAPVSAQSSHVIHPSAARPILPATSEPEVPGRANQEPAGSPGHQESANHE